METKLGIFVLVAFLAVGSLSSFADTTDFESSGNKKEGSLDKGDSSNESNENSKEKRSQENIMFGNQQNKAVVAQELMDPMGNLDKSVQSEVKDSISGNDNKSADVDTEEAKIEDALKDDESENTNRNLVHIPLSSTSDTGDDILAKSEDWYDSAPVPADALRYLLNTSPLQPIHDVNALYDREELYRRKRQLRPRELRKRSLRSPLGQMIQTRGRRLPRRSMRFKRQVEMQDLLSLLNNAESNDAGKFYEQTVPNNFNNYRFPEQSSFRHPYGLNSHEKSLLDEDLPSVIDDLNENKDGDDELLSLSQTSTPVGSNRYFNPDDFQLLDLSPRAEEEDEEFPQTGNWMDREVIIPSSQSPSIFTVSRRSTPLFYPIDYRFVPAYKKRSSFSGRGRNDDQEAEFGKWGRVVNGPDTYASAEDVARLYDLASLLAENESPEIRTHRSA